MPLKVFGSLLRGDMKKPHDIDFNLLASLDVLLKEQNISRAARKLRMQRQTLSNHLNILREEFGDQLLVPERNGMILTARAVALARPLHDALEGLRATLVPKQANTKNPLQGVLTVAASDYALDTLVSPMIERTISNAPKVNFDIRTLDETVLPKQLESGEIDFAICSSDVRSNSLNSELLFKDPMIAIARKSHPIAQVGVTLAAYKKLKRVVYWPRKSADENFTSFASTNGTPKRQISVKVPSFSSVQDIVRNTDLIALIPKRLVGENSNALTSFLPPERVPDIPISILWHDCTNSNPLVRWACNELSAIGNELN